ncbi:MAG: DUF4832 domain-containing protein [Myxococcaceae bacterium]
MRLLVTTVAALLFACAPRPVAGGPDSGPPGSDAGVDAGAEPSLVTVTFTESTAELLNPERGFYDHIDLVNGTGFNGVRAKGMTLALAGVRLDSYRTGPLPQPLLDGLGQGFARVRTAGIKVILRFQYNDGPIGAPDASKAQILAHLGQLAPVLQANADVIAFMQAGFIGAWGEWHNSTNGLDNTTDRKAILTALLQALPASRMVQLRTPHHRDEIFPGGPTTAAQAFGGSDGARTGQHNDCFLASADDYGTYLAPVEQWKTTVAEQCRFTPGGGETCAVNPPRSDCPSATAELSRLHFTYLNSLYHPQVLSGFTTQGCMPELKRRLGYRLVLEALSHSERVRPGGVLHLKATLRNDGYAPLYNARPLDVVLGLGTTSHVATLGTLDVRRWEPGRHTFDVKLRVPANLPEGDYRLSLWLPDAAPALRDRPEYAVRLANDTAFALLPVDASATGAVDPSATDFLQLP